MERKVSNWICTPEGGKEKKKTAASITNMNTSHHSA